MKTEHKTQTLDVKVKKRNGILIQNSELSKGMIGL
jgi:hypothetical protein